MRNRNAVDKYTHNCLLHLSIPADRPLERPVHPEDGRLRWVDDGRAEERAEDAAVGDGEGASLHVLDGQRVLLGLLAEGGDALLDVGVVHVLDVAEDGDNQTLKGKRFGTALALNPTLSKVRTRAKKREKV